MYAVDLHYINEAGKSVVAHDLEEAMEVVRSEARYTQDAANDLRILWTPGTKAGRGKGTWRVSAKSLLVDPVAKTIVLRPAAGATPLLHIAFHGPYGSWVLDPHVRGG